MKQDSRWSDIYFHLKNSGYDVYPPGIKQGECKTPYIVVKGAGVSKAPGISSNVALFDLLVYVPKNSYSAIETFIRGLEEVMDGMFPMIRPSHYQTTPYYDDAVKAWMVSVQYKNYQKNKRP